MLSDHVTKVVNVRTPFEEWWYSRPSYKLADKAAAEEAWNAAMKIKTNKETPK